MTYSQLNWIKRAAAFIELSDAAYDDDISSMIEHHELGDYTKADHNGSYAHFAASDSELVLVFRGTDFGNMLNVVQNVETWQEPCGAGQVHAGIHHHAASVWPMVKDYVAANPNKKIWITGHSMGAATALYTAQQLETLGYTNMELYTYGCPRFGNPHYVKSINTTHWRFVNCVDMIPTVPLVQMGYRHHGTLKYIDRHGRLTSLSTVGKFCDQNIQRMQDIFLHGKIFDIWDYHDPDQYRDKLTQLASAA